MNGPRMSHPRPLTSHDSRADAHPPQAIDARNEPPAIARASHILIKHNESRRVASWRDPQGREIAHRTKAAAIKMLREYKKMIEQGKEDLATLAEQVSDCDTAKHGGDLGWFAANYMQPEFEEAVRSPRLPITRPPSRDVCCRLLPRLLLPRLIFLAPPRDAAGARFAQARGGGGGRALRYRRDGLRRPPYTAHGLSRHRRWSCGVGGGSGSDGSAAGRGRAIRRAIRRAAAAWRLARCG